MSDTNNGGMNFVWVMSEDEKGKAAAAGAVIVVLILLVVGGIWLKDRYFPAESERVSRGQSAQREAERELKRLDEVCGYVEKAAKEIAGGKRDASSLEYLGSNLRESEECIGKCDTAISNVEKQAKKLKKSDQVEMRASGQALAQFAEEARTKLDAYKERRGKADALAAQHLPKG